MAFFGYVREAHTGRGISIVSLFDDTNRIAPVHQRRKIELLGVSTKHVSTWTRTFVTEASLNPEKIPSVDVREGWKTIRERISPKDQPSGTSPCSMREVQQTDRRPKQNGSIPIRPFDFAMPRLGEPLLGAIAGRVTSRMAILR
ncbi:MAG: hypothetical protein M1823_004160 [Watsoniomyces obsoletus]|nr:MAG: hypothetical protein M1823_004160 [Watsoniomyces obsoletus]